MKKSIIIIGAGPAGLTCGLLLARSGHKVIIFESDKNHVGGLSKTVKHKGFRFDIGGHRFFTKDKEVSNFWNSILKNDLVKRKRISRIYYEKKFLSYPLNPVELILKFNPIKNMMFAFSFLKTKIFPKSLENNFENWAIRNFGEKLYLSFFKSYTEKVWGIECSKISSDWAVQRINNLNFISILKDLFVKTFNKNNDGIKSLIEEFDYPTLGPGMLWEKVSAEILALNGEIHLGEEVLNIFLNDTSGCSVTTTSGLKLSTDEIVSSAPLHLTLSRLSPPPPTNILNSLQQFKYRSFITVAIMFKGENAFKDNWLYIHDQDVKVGRIQNYGNWSPLLTPGTDYVCYGMEYFCQSNDEFWCLSDEELFQLALRELKYLKIAFTDKELDFKVIKSEFAYPIYDLEYKDRLDEIKKYINEINNFHLIGRCGLHRYNNQDHSIKTAMLIFQNIESGIKKFDPWLVNQDAEYIETIKLKKNTSKIY